MSEDSELKLALTAAYEDLEAKEPEVAPEAPIEASESAKEAPAEETPAEETDDEPVDPVKTAEEDVPAPRYLKKEYRDAWKNWPSEVREYITGREKEIHEGFSKREKDVQFANKFRQVFSPYEPYVRSRGVEEPLEAVEFLLRAEYNLRHGTPEVKQRTFLALANDCGVNVESLQAPQPLYSPEVQALNERLARLESEKQASQEWAARQREQTFLGELQRFNDDPNTYPHFPEVRNDMAQLLEKGYAKDLSEAYEKAVWLNPVTRSATEDKIRKEAEGKVLSAAKSKADAARKAAASIVGSHARTGTSAAASGGSLRDDLSRAWDRLAADERF
jgi:hypothetical protein